MSSVSGAGGASRTWRILSIDGGGVRGYYTALLIARLCEEHPGWLDSVDLIAGTSTGAIIALALALEMKPADIAAIYARETDRIFTTTLVDKVLDAGGLIGPRYDVRRYAAILRQVFRDARLSDLKRKVMVPAFDLSDDNPDPARRRWKARLLHNLSGPEAAPGLLVRKTALYSSAVPAVFATADGYIDGGAFAANPALCALTLSLDRTAVREPPQLDSIRLFSLGTGCSALHIEGERLQWGLSQWARPLIGVMFDAGVGMVDYQCRQFLGGNYHRLNPWIDGKEIELDDAAALPELRAAAAAVKLDETLAWIDRSWA
ncbi:MAG TPA: patatin-like phospholipase family protein [Gammaproteobacteria bacterium]|nr:patatin-like phospholipase family protein [Gammaproteobacteria bacterium]